MTLLPVLLLILSNVFMTVAWYGHLKFPGLPLWIAIFASWGIALIEYSLAVPANRIGFFHGWSGGQLKITQEIITLIVFAIFAVTVLHEPLSWRHAGAFMCLMGAAAFMFVGRA